ncbi:hypothetical protein SAMN05443575_0606 [Jatrophihabitans endophyticus]|uniref:ATP synthase protein I n=1 Tax=Jatrophihabitans endophyticus TaxID=1206085 RepID=A0A1M5DK45_9ACTN|nr:hypothetical protein [Jatrophihabitans endophyticus]SHF67286.1 hypothetical protein SAMN05443575_0606 [Jatrophihabitans endophyticus]
MYTPASATANLRRSTVIGVALGAVAIAVTSMQGHPWMGAFGLLGIVLGALNNLMLQKAVVRRATGELSPKRFTGSVAGRLGSVTLLAVALAVAVRPDGLGTFVGLAVFQVLMLVGAALPVFRSLRPTT